MFAAEGHSLVLGVGIESYRPGQEVLVLTAADSFTATVYMFVTPRAFIPLTFIETSFSGP